MLYFKNKTKPNKEPKPNKQKNPTKPNQTNPTKQPRPKLRLKCMQSGCTVPDVGTLTEQIGCLKWYMFVHGSYSNIYSLPLQKSFKHTHFDTDNRTYISISY